MSAHVRCTSCDATLLAFAALGDRPVQQEDCPICGGTEFEFVEP